MPNPIVFYRQRAGLSQEDLAVQSGVTLQYLRDLESGHQPRFTARLAPVAVVLDVPVVDLMLRTFGVSRTAIGRLTAAPS